MKSKRCDYESEHATKYSVKKHLIYLKPEYQSGELDNKLRFYRRAALTCIPGPRSRSCNTIVTSTANFELPPIKVPIFF